MLAALVAVLESELVGATADDLGEPLEGGGVVEGAGDEAEAAAQLLAYEFKPGREDLLAGYMEGRTRRELRAAGAKAGMALRPATAVEPYLDMLPELDMLLLMTVEPGFGGQKFLDLVLPKIPDLDERLLQLRDYGLRFIDDFIVRLKAAEAAMPKEVWIELSGAEKAKYSRMLREARLRMTADGVYDTSVMNLLRKVRCKHEPSNEECSLFDE